LILLVLGFAIVALAALAQRGRASGGRPAAAFYCLLVYLVPALVVAFVFASPRDEARRFRLALLGVGFRADRPGERFQVGIGGDRTHDPVWISQLDDSRPKAGPGTKPEPLGTLQFVPGQGRAGKSAAVLRTSEKPNLGFLGWRSPGGKIEPLQTIELREGDRIEAAGKIWRVQTATGALGPPARFLVEGDPKAEPVDLPKRRREILPHLSLPVLTPLSPAEEVYPLRWLVSQAGGRTADVSTEAFLFRRPSAGIGKGSLWLHAPASEAIVHRGNAVVAPPAGRPLRSGQAVHVLLPSVWDGGSFQAKGFRDMRSFRVETGRRSLSLAFETPEVVVLPWVALANLAIVERARPGEAPAASPPSAGAPQPAAAPPSAPSPTPPTPADAEKPLRVNLSLGDWQQADRSLHLRNASDAVAEGALAVLDLPPSLAARGVPGLWSGLGMIWSGGAAESFLVATPRGRLTARLGQPIWLGGEQAAAVQFDLITPPVLLAAVALLLALFAKPWAARVAGLTGAQLGFAALLEALLAVRLLLGYRAWAGAPFSEEAFRLALIAWSLLPWGYLAAAASLRPRDDFDPEPRAVRESLAPLLGGLALSAAWCYRVSGGGLRGLIWFAVHAGLALLLISLRALPNLGENLRERRRRAAERLGAGVARWETTRVGRAAAWTREFLVGWKFWLAISCLPGVFRFVLVIFGFREAAVVGGVRLQLSLFHVPLALWLGALYLGWLWRQVRDDGRLTWRQLAPAAGFALFGWALPAIVAHDNGLALVCLPGWLLAVAGLALAARRRAAELGEQSGAAWTLPLLALGLYLACTVLPFGARLYVALSPEGEGSNYLRFLGFGYPAQLEDVGERESERLAVMFAALHSYTSRPMDEARYFTSEVSPHLKATALREHAAAIFLAGEWGPAGTIGVLLLYFLAANLGWRLAPWGSEADDDEPSGLTGRSLALLAGLTFSTASLYMLLANYRLTLFTGKNPYLLGLDSTADLLEALVLAVLFALGSAYARAEDDA